MGLWPRHRQRFELDHPADRDAVTGRQGPPEAPAECPALAERAAAEYDPNVNPAPNRDVRAQPRANRSYGEARAAGDPHRPPSWRPIEMTTRDGNQRISVESERWTSGRAFELRGVLMVANDSIRDGGGEPIGRPTRRNSETLETWPTPILDRGPAAGLDDLDHDVGTKRSRSPGLKRAGGSAAGSKTRIVVRPIRFHPPGLSTA